MGSDWVSLEEAWEQIEAHTRPLPSETLPRQQASGRVLARPVRTDRDVPPFPRAAMDGFAVRSFEVKGATAAHPVELQVVGESTPGRPYAGSSSPASAVRIMTGAAVPDDWDSIVPVEETSGFESNPVVVQAEVMPGEHVAPQGSERRAGEEVLFPGQRLRAVDVAALAMIGVSQVEVGRRPRVAILATGNELVAPGRTPGRTQIRDSNTPLLEAMVAAFATSSNTGHSSDDPQELAVSVARGLLSEVLLVTGGVSMGLYDGVVESLEAAGVKVHFRRVALQPGKPVVFGTHSGGSVLALPGNPVSALTTCRLFALPLLRLLQGEVRVRPRWSSCTARFEWKRRHEKTLFLPGRRVEAGAAVERVPYAGSGDLLAYTRADCQIVLQREVDRVVPGDAVSVWPF